MEKELDINFDDIHLADPEDETYFNNKQNNKTHIIEPVDWDDI